MSHEEEDFEKMLGASLKAAEKTYAVGDRVSAEIVSIGTEDAIVALGSAKEGLVAAAELAGRKAGENVNLFVTAVKGTRTRLSIHPTDKNIAEDLQEAFESHRPIEGRVSEICKGGVRVSIRGKSAFCPISQLDVKRVEDAAPFVGRTFAFRITEFAEGGRNVVLSRRKLLEEEQAGVAAAFLAANPDGSIVAGKVTRLEKFGAFVELAPGLEGLAHISELAWSRVESPAELLRVGQEVAVKLLKRETIDGRLKLSLSLKQAAEKPATPAAPAIVDPWTKYAAGNILEGKITRKEPYGLFVQLEPGVVGLLHQSKATEHGEFDFAHARVGDVIAVEVGEVKLSERRISLQLPRDPEADAWREHQQAGEPSMGILGENLRAALEKKKR